MTANATTTTGPAGLTQCRTCGVERDAGDLPDLCPICADERQYLADDDVQHWVDPAAFDGTIDVVEREPGLWGLDVEASIGIGQQAKIVVTGAGNVMVDVPAAITADAVRAVRDLGPMAAIIPSHPHMFGVQSLWSRALDDAPVYVATADQHWLGHRPAALRLWDEPIEPVPGITASQPGGHFPGSAVVHWTGADGAGVLLTGDTVRVNPDRRTVAFMRSYPDQIPLSPAVVTRMAAHLGRYAFDRLYGNFTDRLADTASERVQRSARRHVEWVRGDHDDLTGAG